VQDFAYNLVWFTGIVVILMLLGKGLFQMAVHSAREMARTWSGMKYELGVFVNDLVGKG